MLYFARYDRESFKSKDRILQHKIGKDLLKAALLREFHVDFESMTQRKNKYGKPYFDNSKIYYNISHCPGVVCCGLSLNEIGVDVELIRDLQNNIAKRICSDCEIKQIKMYGNPKEALIRMWSLKESYTKLVGSGISFGMRDIKCCISKGSEEIMYSTVFTVQKKIYPNYILSACSYGKIPEKIIELNILN